MSESKLATYLESNPRKVGVLFTMLVLLTQAGNALAGNQTIVAGP